MRVSSTDPIPAGLGGFDNLATRSALDALVHGNGERAARVYQLRDQFLGAAAECRVDMVVTFAPRVRDVRSNVRRHPTMGEVLGDALDYRDFTERAMQVLLDAAAGRGTQRAAQQLLEDVAAHWADLEVTE
jgi:hypothetical protein